MYDAVMMLAHSQSSRHCEPYRRTSKESIVDCVPDPGAWVLSTPLVCVIGTRPLLLWLLFFSTADCNI